MPDAARSPHRHRTKLDPPNRHGRLDGIETHDCFSMTEYMAVDHFGITAPGESWKAIEDGTIARSATTVVSFVVEAST
jgi:acetyl-CoA C-acetyltransferase